jgi:hypothetical protein
VNGDSREEQRAPEHRRAISRALVAAATAFGALVAGACSDVLLPGDRILGTAELLILRIQPGAPAPGSVTFVVSNDAPTVIDVRHDDANFTLFVRLTFAAGALASLNGQPLDADDAVEVTVTPRAGEYGFTFSPAGLEFTPGNEPTARFEFAVYGDFSVADGSPTYPTRDAYAGALDIWEEVSPDRWRVALGSRSAGLDQVIAALAAGGEFLLAAPR